MAQLLDCVLYRRAPGGAEARPAGHATLQITQGLERIAARQYGLLDRADTDHIPWSQLQPFVVASLPDDRSLHWATLIVRPKFMRLTALIKMINPSGSGAQLQTTYSSMVAFIAQAVAYEPGTGSRPADMRTCPCAHPTRMGAFLLHLTLHRMPSPACC